MIRPQLILDLNPELIIDNFAGGGGASTGIELALGRHVDHAVNHSREALGMHRINHPQTIHHCEDVFDIDPETICEGRPVGLCHNSPDCKHFSKAKGGKPLDKRIRGLVLVMLKWAKYGARVMTMENVEEIVTWGPLKKVRKNGKVDWYADPEHKGRTWHAFLDILSTGIDPNHPDLPEILEVLGGYITEEDCVRGFGYAYEAREIRACDQGTPTIRKRLFMIARRDGRPIVWPAPSHAPKDSGSGLPAYRTIAECIDWELPTPSIFLSRGEAKRWRCKRPLAKATMRRIAKGVDRYVLKAKQPFIVSLTHQGGDRVEPVTEPSMTVTGAHRGEKALVSPFLTEHANASIQRNMPMDEPGRTACAQVKGGHFALVAGTLVHTAHGDQDKNGKRRGRGAHDLGESMPSALGSSDCALAAAGLVKLRGNVETHSRPQSAGEPLETISAGGTHHGLFAASIVREFGQSVGQPADAPAPTVLPAGQGKTRVLACYLAQHNGGEVGHQTVGHDARDPFSTISQKGSQQQVVVANLGAYYGTDQDVRLDQPGHTVTTKDRFPLVESTLVSPMTADQIAGALRVAAFLRAHGVVFEGTYATVDGYVIVDIGMRMLTPRELFRAQGFSDGYVIDRAWVVDTHTGNIEEIRLTKEQQIRMCGNSVCPQVMRDIVRCNVPELGVWKRGEQKKLRARLTGVGKAVVSL